jgi:hypothetical protein
VHVEEEHILNGNDMAIGYKNKLDVEREKIHEFIFNQKYLKYEKNLNSLTKDMLGSLKPISIYRPNYSEDRNSSFSNRNTTGQNDLFYETKVIHGHASGVSALALLHNGDLASSSYDKTIKVKLLLKLF